MVAYDKSQFVSQRCAYLSTIRLRERAPGFPVIFCSGYTGDIMEVGGASFAEAPLLTKPVDPDLLLRKMRELLGAAALPGESPSG